MRRFTPSRTLLQATMVQAQNNRAGMDYADFDGSQNAAASLDGFNYTSQASMDANDACVFPGEINGSDSMCRHKRVEPRGV